MLLSPILAFRSLKNRKDLQAHLWVLSVEAFISSLDNYIKSQSMDDDSFCYWDVKNLPDAVIAVTFMAIVICIFTITLLRIRKIKKYKQHASIARIYILITFWALVFASQLLYGISVYFFAIMDKEPSPKDMDAYSRSYTRIDIIPGFMVQTLFLQICKLYYKGLTNSIEISRLAKWQIKFIKLLKGYCIVRIVNQSIGILLVNIFSQSNQIPLFLKINILILVVDCAIINVLLLVSLKIYIVRFSESGRIYKADLKQLKKEYLIMIITSLLRIAIDVNFLVLPIVGEESQKQCIGEFDGHLVRTIVYNCLSNVINHILPIIWFLKIYSFQSLQNKNARYSSQNSGNQLIRSILE